MGKLHLALRRVPTILAVIPLVVAAVVSLGAPGRAPPAPAKKPFLYPRDGQSVVFEGDYRVKAASIPHATRYLIQIMQGNELRIENHRDYGTYGQELVVRRGDRQRGRLLPNIPTTLTVRALVNGRWTKTKKIAVRLVPRTAQVKVLELRYFPLDQHGMLDQTETSLSGYSLAEIRKRVDQLSNDTESDLEASTVYARQKAIGKYLTYTKVATVEKLEKVPKSSTFRPFADHLTILRSQRICDWVDRRGVRDVWIWMYHTDVIAPIESNMSMGRVSARFFNHGGYGDVSNSWQHNDLPVCSHTYVVYNFNYGRGLSESLENYGHQRERLFDWADAGVFARFVNPFGASYDGTRACGNVENPPNSRKGYDWENTQSVPSNCSDWHPDGSGEIEQVSCVLWDCSRDPGRWYKVWWAQRVPGRGASLALKETGRRMRNWNELLADFDVAAALGRRLTE